MVGELGRGEHLARCLAPGRRDSFIEAVDLLPERASGARRLIGIPPADQVSRRGGEEEGAAIEGEKEGFAALARGEVPAVDPELARTLISPALQMVPEEEKVGEGVEAGQLLEGREAAAVVVAGGNEARPGDASLPAWGETLPEPEGFTNGGRLGISRCPKGIVCALGREAGTG